MQINVKRLFQPKIINVSSSNQHFRRIMWHWRLE